jgi:hypothetical protein
MVIPKRLIEGSQLTASVATYYTAPDRTPTTEKTRTYIRKLTLTNTSAAEKTVTIYLVPADGAALDANMLVKDRSIAAGQTITVSEANGHILEPGASIQAVASAATAVTIIASGVEFRG